MFFVICPFCEHKQLCSTVMSQVECSNCHLVVITTDDDQWSYDSIAPDQLWDQFDALTDNQKAVVEARAAFLRRGPTGYNDAEALLGAMGEWSRHELVETTPAELLIAALFGADSPQLIATRLERLHGPVRSFEGPPPGNLEILLTPLNRFERKFIRQRFGGDDMSSDEELAAHFLLPLNQIKRIETRALHKLRRAAAGR